MVLLHLNPDYKIVWYPSLESNSNHGYKIIGKTTTTTTTTKIGMPLNNNSNKKLEKTKLTKHRVNCAKKSACVASPISCSPRKSPCFLTKEPHLTVARKDKTLPRIQNTSQNPKHFPETRFWDLFWILRARSFGMIRIRISDPRSLGSC